MPAIRFNSRLWLWWFGTVVPLLRHLSLVHKNIYLLKELSHEHSAVYSKTVCGSQCDATKLYYNIQYYIWLGLKRTKDKIPLNTKLKVCFFSRAGSMEGTAAHSTRSFNHVSVNRRHSSYIFKIHCPKGQIMHIHMLTPNSHTNSHLLQQYLHRELLSLSLPPRPPTEPWLYSGGGQWC